MAQPITTPVARRKPPLEPPRPDLRLAAVDVGSNSLHMIVGQIGLDGSVTTVWRAKEMVGLGRASFPSRRLSRDGIERSLLALRRFQQEAYNLRCEKIIAVATSAVREASNGGDFIERARRELGIKVRIVSARDEARLIYVGVRHCVDMNGGPHLIVDIGGGSVEFIVADQSRPMLLESRKLGAARMTAKFIHSDPVEADELRKLLRHCEGELAPLVRDIEALAPGQAWGTSGTLENLAAMCGTGASADGKQPGVIEAERLSRLVGKLIESRTKDRAKLDGLDEQRRDQIVAGAVLANEIFRRLDLKRMTLCSAALREGILIEYIERHRPDLAVRSQIPDPRRRSIFQIARRCNWEEPHSRHVTELTLQMFDQLSYLHRMGKTQRELIEYGSLLHDIGWHIGGKKHHRHSMYLIMHADLRGFSRDEVMVIANIARYHRRSPPKNSHPAFAALPAADRKVVRLGAALLRVADGLDRSHNHVVHGVRFQSRDGRIVVKLATRGDPALEIWGANRKKDLFEEVFDRPVSFKAEKG